LPEGLVTSLVSFHSASELDEFFLDFVHARDSGLVLLLRMIPAIDDSAFAGGLLSADSRFHGATPESGYEFLPIPALCLASP
jgi:hypothetical protein